MRTVIVAGCAAVVAGYLSVGVANADPCFLPHGVPARVPPAGMDDSIWPPCEATYHQWQVPAHGSQVAVCPSVDGTPDGIWCIYTDPGNGKQYVIAKGINQRVQ